MTYSVPRYKKKCEITVFSMYICCSVLWLSLHSTCNAFKNTSHSFLHTVTTLWRCDLFYYFDPIGIRKALNIISQSIKQQQTNLNYLQQHIFSNPILQPKPFNEQEQNTPHYLHIHSLHYFRKRPGTLMLIGVSSFAYISTGWKPSHSLFSFSFLSLTADGI